MSSVTDEKMLKTKFSLENYTYSFKVCPIFGSVSVSVFLEK